MRILFTSFILAAILFLGCTKPNTVDWEKIFGDKDTVAITDEDTVTGDDLQPEEVISDDTVVEDGTVTEEEGALAEEDQVEADDAAESSDDTVETGDDTIETGDDAVEPDADTVDIDTAEVDTVEADVADIDNMDLDTVDEDTVDIQPDLDVDLYVDTTPPTVTATVPLDVATDVALGTTIEVTFNEPMNETTLTTTTITVVDETPATVNGTLAYNAGNYTAVFTPSASLAYDTVYTVTVTTGVEDGAGNGLAANYEFTFTTAANEINECIVNNNPCDDASDSGATCTDIIGGYTCTCSSGFAPGGGTCQDVNECTLDTDNCAQNCQNTVGSHTCTCNNGYTLNGDGHTCNDINECVTLTNPCNDNNDTSGSCTNTDGAYTCTCSSGYSFSGGGCRNINECLVNDNPCNDNGDVDAVCSDLQGSYSCVCNATGFSFQNGSCRDIDECVVNSNPCNDNGDTTATCTNTTGSYTCGCNFGYDFTLGGCRDLDECALGTDTCHVNADCTNTTGSYTCACKLHYSGSGYTCIADTQTFTCAAKPANSDWNTVSSYTQTWNGSAWSPADSVTSFNVTGSTTACRFTCLANYTWNGSVCVIDTTTVLCSGQTLCYNNTTTMTCPTSDASYYGQDGQYAALGYCIPRDYSVSGTGGSEVVTDNNTGLEWQRTLSTDTYTWSNAITYCDNLTYGGYSDWRLPTRKELATIPDYGRTSLAIDTTMFPGTQADYFWTSSPFMYSSTTLAWYVFFYDGHVSGDYKTNTMHARCVRGDALLDNAFTESTISDKVIVTDTVTGLIWTKECSSAASTWVNALSYCENLNYAGHIDWRLPNVNELKTLIDDTLYDPASTIPGVVTHAFWSSSSYVSNTAAAWYVDFKNGAAYKDFKTNISGYARCVRSDVGAPVDECVTMNNPCNDHGDTTATCTNTTGSYACGCNFGFEFTLGGCHDIDECTQGTDTCDVNADCTNTTGSYSCTCKTHYSGNGYTCTADTQTFTCAAKPMVSAAWNTVSSYTQTWNGSAWSPADSTTNYNETPSTTNCRYKCADGYMWEGAYCVTNETCVTGEWKTQSGVVFECVAEHWIIRRVTKQWGTSSAELGSSVAVDSLGNIYVSGHTSGNLDENTNSGNTDIFLTKWEANGTKVWTRQWGTVLNDYGSSVGVDLMGNIYVAGHTAGNLDGNTNAGDTDIFLTKWNTNGTKAWTKQWGTNFSDMGFSLATDSLGNIYVVGYTVGNLDGNTGAGNEDLFLTKWNANGTKAWTKQWGTSSGDRCHSVVIDPQGNIYVAGETYGSLDGNTSAGNANIFLTKWNPAGTKVWTKEWGANLGSSGLSVALDSFGNIYVAGHTSGSLDGNSSFGGYDLFLTMWDADGTKAWTRQWGTTAIDWNPSTAVDTKGNIFVTGETRGSLDGNTSIGGSDAFLTDWDVDGIKVWTKQWGTSSDDISRSIAVDSVGNVYLTGYTTGALDGNSKAGDMDIFLSIIPAE